MRRYHWLLLLLIIACGKEKTVPELQDDLATYIAENPEFPVVTDSLIACAAGGGDVLVNDASFPVSILFYPKASASNFLYFETEDAAIDPSDFSAYALQDLEDAPILNGYLRKFRRPGLQQNKWGIVAYFRNKEIHISNPIRLKYDDKPTENNPSLLECSTNESLRPLFTWQDGAIDENEIYFQVVTNAAGNLISGTYTYERSFRFYDLSNVVLNIRDVQPAPVLEAGEPYSFIMMAVSEDNWVNLVMKKDFIAE